MKSSITAILIVTTMLSPLLWLLSKQSFVYCIQVILISSISGAAVSELLKWFSERNNGK